MQYSASNPVRKEFLFSALHHGDKVLWAELWFMVVCRYVIWRQKEGAPKIFRKLLQRRNHSSGNIMRRCDNYSNYFLVFLTFEGVSENVSEIVSETVSEIVSHSDTVTH